MESQRQEAASPQPRPLPHPVALLRKPEGGATPRDSHTATVVPAPRWSSTSEVAEMRAGCHRRGLQDPRARGSPKPAVVGADVGGGRRGGPSAPLHSARLDLFLL